MDKIYEVKYGPFDEGRLDVKVKFTNGKVYYIVFVDTGYAEGELGALGCFAVPGLIILDETTMDRVQEVIGHIVRSGYFNHLVPIEDDGE